MHYASDITRTFPANGKFSNKQKEIYEEMSLTMPSLNNITWDRLDIENSVTYPSKSPTTPGEEIVFGDKTPMESKKLRLKDYIEELDAFHAEGDRSEWPSTSSEEHMTFYGHRFTYGSLSPGLAVIAVGWCSKF